jgi:molecular chaperone GrpE
MENLRRRSEREASEARQYAITAFARELLSVADNLRRTLEAIPAEMRAADPAGLGKLVEGVELTEREFLRVLAKHGVRRIEAEGARFDPNFHQAIFEVEDGSLPSGTVAQVAQTGYALGDRVLRPAMVAVSRGGPRPGRPPAGGSEREAAGAGDSAG